jgi:hypothetical protein
MSKTFIVPTKTVLPEAAKESLRKLIEDYKEEIVFDNNTGLIYIDGSKDLPYSKEYWLPTNENKKEDQL